jgi:hypothetical protein
MRVIHGREARATLSNCTTTLRRIYGTTDIVKVAAGTVLLKS